MFTLIIIIYSTYILHTMCPRVSFYYEYFDSTVWLSVAGLNPRYNFYSSEDIDLGIARACFSSLSFTFIHLSNVSKVNKWVRMSEIFHFITEIKQRFLLIEKILRIEIPSRHSNRGKIHLNKNANGQYCTW